MAAYLKKVEAGEISTLMRAQIPRSTIDSKPQVMKLKEFWRLEGTVFLGKALREQYPKKDIFYNMKLFIAANSTY